MAKSAAQRMREYRQRQRGGKKPSRENVKALTSSPQQGLSDLAAQRVRDLQETLELAVFEQTEGARRITSAMAAKMVEAGDDLPGLVKAFEAAREARAWLAPFAAASWRTALDLRTVDRGILTRLGPIVMRHVPPKKQGILIAELRALDAEYTLQR